MKRVLFAVFLAVPAFAQSTPQQPTINDTIVVTASSLPEGVEVTPASVTVITRKEIDERVANDVADVYGFARESGYSLADRRHRLVTSAIVELPWHAQVSTSRF